MFSDSLNTFGGLFRAQLRGLGNGFAGAAHEGGGLILQAGMKKSGRTKDVGKTGGGRHQGKKKCRREFCVLSLELNSRLHRPQGIKSHLTKVLPHCAVW